MFDNLIEKNKDNIINTLCDLIKFDSVSIENDNDENPFGKTCTDVLNHTLEIASSMGFKTKNIDNYCGYIEFGEGEELVGIVGHLDVVPANINDGWTTSPFEAYVRDGKLFGRGSIDDKGPVVASLYAMKVIMDNVKISKRVRLILGLNEEKSWKCINYYKTHEQWPSIGFSPDANFPAIYAEKGIMSIELKNKFSIKNFEIVNIDCQNNAINVVPKYCCITLKNTLNTNINLEQTTDIKISYIDNIIKIESFGVASHAAHPELGNNAIANLVKYLLNNFEFSSDYLKFIYDNGVFDITSPKFLGEKIEDETGILTSNVAIIDYKDENLIIKINLRVPCSYKLNDIFEKYKSIAESIEVSKFGMQEPLFTPKDDFLVKTLVSIFNKKTGLNESPIAIGGGTYARAFENFISYGATMPGDKDMCHQVDEFIEIDKLILSAKIYAEAIYELAK